MRPGPLHEAGQIPARTGAEIGRRWLLRALPAAVVLAAATQARAASSGGELVLACDTTLGPAMRAAANLYANVTGTQVNVFPTPPGLILPQLQRDVQNDIVVTRVATMNAAIQASVVAQGAAQGAWHDRLVVAAKRGAPPVPGKPIAVCDPSPACDMDGLAILARLAMLPAATLGVLDSDAVAALVISGQARAGLLHMTDVRAHPELEVINVVPDDVEPASIYAVAVTRLASRPNPQGFIEFITASQGIALLATLGLETPSS
jgi:molybdate transport system substrate-binding protein